jgi:adenylate cyclase
LRSGPALIKDRKRTTFGFLAGTVALLIGLPIAVWLDLRGVADRMLRDEAYEIGRIISVINDYYGREIVAKLHPEGVASPGQSVPTANAIPPMMSPELGRDQRP